MNMRRKPGVSFDKHFPKSDKAALKLLRRMLAFDPSERPTSEEALADAYFHGGQGVRSQLQAVVTCRLPRLREGRVQPLSKLEGLHSSTREPVLLQPGNACWWLCAAQMCCACRAQPAWS